MATTVDDLLSDARRRLAAAPFSPPPREAALLLGRVLGWSEAMVMARGEEAVPPAATRRFRELLERRLGGEPVAYLLGEREFYGRVFHVDRRVLIPRPESEHLVEAALELHAGGALPGAPRILDLGTGSGCLAVSLALEIPGARVLATDLSPAALALATANARRLGAGGVRFAAHDLWRGLDPRRFDLVVSNPPYVGRDEAPGLSPEVTSFEPHLALFAGPRGEDVLRRLLAGAAELRQGVPLLLEIGRGQLPALRRLAAASGLHGLTLQAVIDDYAGIPRVVHLRR